MSESVEISFAGLKLNIQTDGNEDQVRAAAAMVQQQFDELKKSGTIIDSSKIMALIALNLADELLSKNQSNPELMNSVISTLDQAIAQAQGIANVSLR